MRPIDWIKQFVLIMCISSAILTLIQFSKGSTWHHAIAFGLLWGFISTLVFLLVKIIKFKRAGLPVFIRKG